MDKEEAVKLDASLIENGKKVIKVLDNTVVKPTSVFWFYFADLESWRLIISSPYYTEKNSQDCYKDFIDRTNKTKFTRLKISDVTLVPENNDLVNLLKVAVKTEADAIDGITFTSNTINGVFIENAYIYRLS